MERETKEPTGKRDRVRAAAEELRCTLIALKTLPASLEAVADAIRNLAKRTEDRLELMEDELNR